MVGIGHNAMHKSDVGNYWKYVMDIHLSSSHNWRVLHDLSHHHYPNTELDMEAYFSEPVLNYLSNKPNNNLFITIFWPISVCLFHPLNWIASWISWIIRWGERRPENCIPIILYGILYLARGYNHKEAIILFEIM